MFYLGFDWLRQIVIFFLNWTACVFLIKVLIETIHINSMDSSQKLKDNSCADNIKLTDKLYN